MFHTRIRPNLALFSAFLLLSLGCGDDHSIKALDVGTPDANRGDAAHSDAALDMGSQDLGDDRNDASSTQCGPDERVLDGACVACAPGTTNQAGDDALGVDTVCEAVTCGQNEHVVDNACVSCPAGSTNQPDDDASGANTECDDACSLALGVTCAQFEQAYIKASNTESDDQFGRVLALSGNTLAVGASQESSSSTGVNPPEQTNNSAIHSGAVYVFVRTGDTWSQQAFLKASNTGSRDGFGSAVALDGDVLAVGAPSEKSNATGVDGAQNDNSVPQAGAVYVFSRSGTTWSQQAYLKSSNTEAYDYFGSSLALDGGLLAVAARGEDSSAPGVDGNQSDNSLISSGAVYLFSSSNGTWSQQAYIKASNPGESDSFGHSMALKGDTLAVSAVREDSASDGVDSDQTDDSLLDSGAVYVFARVGSAWTQQAYLKASNPGRLDEFGQSVALGVDTVAVGAPGESGGANADGFRNDESVFRSGAVYLFTRSAGVWSQSGFLKASTPGSGDRFGTSVALNSQTLVAGAPGEGSNATGFGGDESDDSFPASGAAYLFTKSGNVWSQQAYIKASNSNTNDYFGSPVALDGDTVAIGAYGEGSSATGVDGDQSDNSLYESGAVYVRQLAP